MSGMYHSHENASTPLSINPRLFAPLVVRCRITEDTSLADLTCIGRLLQPPRIGQPPLSLHCLHDDALIPEACHNFTDMALRAAISPIESYACPLATSFLEWKASLCVPEHIRFLLAQLDTSPFTKKASSPSQTKSVHTHFLPTSLPKAFQQPSV